MRKLALLLLLASVTAAGQMKYAVSVISPSDANAKELFQGQPGVLIKNDEVLFAIGIPKGWDIDLQSGADRGIGAIFYPKDGPPTTRVYIDTLKKPDGNTSAVTVMKQEVSATAKARKVEIEWLEDEKTGGPDKASLVLIQAETHSLIIAYIDRPKAIVKLVLAAADPKQLKQSTPLFHSLIGSFHALDESKMKITPPAQ